MLSCPHLAEPDIDLVGEADTASLALARNPAVQRDVAVLDVRLPGAAGYLCAGEIRSGMPEVAC